MLIDLFPKAHRRYANLPVLGPLVDAYAAWSREQGYRRESRRDQLHALAWIDRDLQRRGLRRGSGISRDDLDASGR